MASLFSQEEYSLGMDVHLNRFSPTEIFPYAPYTKNKAMFHVPIIRKRFMLITNREIVDLKVHSFKVSMATVSDVHNMSDLLKIKFKKGEVISLTFKGDKIQQYAMRDTDSCLQYIRGKMTENGIKSNVLSQRFKKNIATAQGLIDTVKEIEAEFEEVPSYDLVACMMDLLRDAVELFGEADDSRYLQALDHIQSFLLREDVTAILEQQLPQRRSKGNTSDKKCEEVDENIDSLLSSTDQTEHLSQRLKRQIGGLQQRQEVATSPGAETAIAVAAVAKSIATPPVVSRGNSFADGSDIFARGESSEALRMSVAASRPRVASRVRRGSIRTQDLETKQFETMDNIHFDDAEEALWVEDDEVVDIDYDKDEITSEDENIALLDSLIGNMANELEGIIGEPFDLTAELGSPTGGYLTASEQEGLGIQLTRGLSSFDV